MRKKLLGASAVGGRGRAQVSYDLSAAVDEVARLEECLRQCGGSALQREQLLQSICTWQARVEGLSSELRALQPMFSHISPSVAELTMQPRGDPMSSVGNGAMGMSAASAPSRTSSAQQQHAVGSANNTLATARQHPLVTPPPLSPSPSLMWPSQSLTSSAIMSAASPMRSRSTRSLKLYVDSDLRAMGVYRPLPIVRQMPLSVVRRLKCAARRFKAYIRDRNANRVYEATLWRRVGRVLLARMRAQERAGRLWRRLALRKPLRKWRSVTSQTLLATDHAIGRLRRVQGSTSVGRCFFAWMYLTKVAHAVLRGSDAVLDGDDGAVRQRQHAQEHLVAGDCDNGEQRCECSGRDDGEAATPRPVSATTRYHPHRQRHMEAIAECVERRANERVDISCLVPVDAFMSRAKAFLIERELERLCRTVPLTKAFLGWRQYAHHRQAKQQLAARAVDVRRRCMGIAALFKWRGAAAVHHATHRRQRARLLVCFSGWRVHVRACLLERRRFNTFVAGVDGRCKQRLLSKWRKRTLTAADQETQDVAQADAIAKECNSLSFLALFSVLSTWSVCTEVGTNPAVCRALRHAAYNGEAVPDGEPSLALVSAVVSHAGVVGQLSIDAQWLLARARMIVCFLRWRLLLRWSRRLKALLGSGEDHPADLRRASSPIGGSRVRVATGPVAVLVPRRASALAHAVSSVLFGATACAHPSTMAVGDDVVNVVARHSRPVAPLLFAWSTPLVQAAQGESHDDEQGPLPVVSFAALRSLNDNYAAIASWATEMELRIPGVLQPPPSLLQHDDGGDSAAADVSGPGGASENSDDDEDAASGREDLPLCLQAAITTENDDHYQPTRGERLAALRLRETRLIGGLSCRMAAARYAHDTSSGALLGFTATKVELNIHELFVRKRARCGKKKKRAIEKSGGTAEPTSPTTVGSQNVPSSVVPTRTISPRPTQSPPLSAKSKPTTARRGHDESVVVLPSFSGEHIIAVSTLGTTSVGGTKKTVGGDGGGGGVLPPPTPSPSPLPPRAQGTDSGASPNLRSEASDAVTMHYDAVQGGTGEGDFLVDCFVSASPVLASSRDGGGDVAAGGSESLHFALRLPESKDVASPASSTAVGLLAPTDEAGCLELELIAAASQAAMMPPADLNSPRWAAEEVHATAAVVAVEDPIVYAQLSSAQHASVRTPQDENQCSIDASRDTVAHRSSANSQDGDDERAVPAVVIPTAHTDTGDVPHPPPLLAPNAAGPYTLEESGVDEAEADCMPNSIRGLQFFAWTKQPQRRQTADEAIVARVPPPWTSGACGERPTGRATLQGHHKQMPQAGTLYGTRAVPAVLPSAGFPAQSLRRRRSLQPSLHRRVVPSASDAAKDAKGLKKST